MIFFADSRSRIGLSRNVLAKPNRSELIAAVGSGVGPALGATPAAATHSSEVQAAAQRLSKLTGRAVYATVGPDGILYVDRDTVCHVPGVPVTGPIDIVGAGTARRPESSRPCAPARRRPRRRAWAAWWRRSRSNRSASRERPIRNRCWQGFERLFRRGARDSADVESRFQAKEPLASPVRGAPI